MRLVSYYLQGLRIGAVLDDKLFDLRRVYELYLLEEERDPSADDGARSRVPADMARFIQRNHGELLELEHALDRISGDEERWAWCLRLGVACSLADAHLLPPVLRPSKIINVGSSYRGHVEGTAKVAGREAQAAPDPKISFLKAPSAVAGPGEPIKYPPGSTMWDYEGELALVIGRAPRDIVAADALDHVFGYCAFNDACVRDVPPVQGGHTSPGGKSGDTLAPIGPCIVTSDNIPDPNHLWVRAWVDGELRQDAHTSDLLWPVEEILVSASRVMRLLPGDIIATGASAGIGLESGNYLKSGDVVRIEIEGIGALENRVAGHRPSQPATLVSGREP